MILGSGWVRSAPGLGAIGTVTRVGKTTRVAIAATATGMGLVVGVVGVVPAVDDRSTTGLERRGCGRKCPRRPAHSYDGRYGGRNAWTGVLKRP